MVPCSSMQGVYFIIVYVYLVKLNQNDLKQATKTSDITVDCIDFNMHRHFQYAHIQIKQSKEPSRYLISMKFPTKMRNPKLTSTL